MENQLRLPVSLMGLFFLFLSTQAVSSANWQHSGLFGIQIAQEKFGKNCGSSSSYQVDMKNNSLIGQDVQICLLRTDGSWACGIDSNVPPQGTTGPSYVCQFGGQVKTFSRQSGSKDSFPKASSL